MKKMLLGIMALALAASPLWAKPGAKALGTVTSVSGKATLYTGADKSGSGLKTGKAVLAGDRIRTGANGRVSLVLTDGTQLKVNYLTDITLRDTDVKGKASERGVGSIKVALGNLWAKVTKKNSRLEFETPSAVAAVKGTEPTFDVSESGDLCVKLKEGKLDLSSDLGGAASLEELQQICIKKGVKFGQNDVNKWDGSGNGWTQETGGATSATVTLKVKDRDGKEQEVKVEYAK